MLAIEDSVRIVSWVSFRMCLFLCLSLCLAAKKEGKVSLLVNTMSSGGDPMVAEQDGSALVDWGLGLVAACGQGRRRLESQCCLGWISLCELSQCILFIWCWHLTLIDQQNLKKEKLFAETYEHQWGWKIRQCVMPCRQSLSKHGCTHFIEN